MSDNEDEKNLGFKVVDKRSFFEDGTPRHDLEEETIDDKKAETEKPEINDDELYGIDFPTFLLQLASSVQLHLGMIPHPATGQPMQDIDRAIQTINLMKMLVSKTKGNLGAKETHLVHQIVKDCEMHLMHLSQNSDKE